ncbi:uncharacterized protein J4E84_000218 [Alternaria hordeiaustralica]|uniref:uncharacterized protein n=1 Tax=Alternaria hordeiaustralica TaxID=1187925 RepID=UPI0020C4B5D5|nr:uncharacterized protein J4E84_000218 [Alternaria hordeiaustralica]KAI4697093.1 hypothetical protein J4E84_000218 [Alternaria hordeiaustralica]
MAPVKIKNEPPKKTEAQIIVGLQEHIIVLEKRLRKKQRMGEVTDDENNNYNYNYNHDDNNYNNYNEDDNNYNYNGDNDNEDDDSEDDDNHSKDSDDDDDGDVAPIFSNTSDTQLALRLDGVTRQRDQYKGAIEVGLVENTKLREERDHYRDLYMGVIRSTGSANTNSVSNNNFLKIESNSTHYHINMAQDNNPFSGFVKAPKPSEPSEPEVKRPIYGDQCHREKRHKPCRKTSCPYWHRSQGARFAAIRPTLFSNKAAENRAQRR